MSVTIDRESGYAELVLNVGRVTLGEKSRKGMKKGQPRREQNETLQRAVVALLNSGGGVVKAEIENEDYIYEMEGIGHDLETSFSILLPCSVSDYLDFMQQDKYFLVFVKTRSSDTSTVHVASLSTCLYKRDITSTRLIDDTAAPEFLRNRVKNGGRLSTQSKPTLKKRRLEVQEERNMAASAAEFFNRTAIGYREKLKFTESTHVELKSFTTAKLSQRIKEILPQYVSAFANTDGGYLFIGLDDHEEVIGFNADENELKEIQREIEESVNKLPVYHFCGKERQIGYLAKFIQVLDDKSSPCGYVLALKIEQFCCVAFAKQPDSWHVEDNTVKQFTVKEWIRHAIPDFFRLPENVGTRRGSPSSSSSPYQDLAEAFESQLNISHSPPRCRPVYCRKGLEHKVTLQQRLFPVSPGLLQYAPESLWEELCTEHDGLEEIMCEQTQHCPQGILILSRSWAVDLNLPEQQGVICDALLVAQDSSPILYTVLGHQDVDGQLYCTRTAFALKQKLVYTGSYTGKLCVLTRVLQLNAQGGAEAEAGSDCAVDYPESYRLLDAQALQSLLQSLVIVLLSFRSLLSDQLGYEVLNLLTEQQYKIISQSLRKNRELFVHGLPGTGKTVLAVKIMEKIKNTFHCEQRNILYICENQPLREFISDKGICYAVTRKHFMNNQFEDAQHIVIDEAQNFRREDGDWYEKAKAITQRERNHPGILWVFLDYFQINHTECTGLPPLAAQNSREELTRVIRNADPIGNYLKELVQKVIEDPPRNIPAEAQQMLLEAEWTSGVQGTCVIKPHLNLRLMITYIADTCKDLFERGYSPKDVAVLVSTTQKVELYKSSLRKALRKHRVLQIGGAGDVLGEHVVLDSVRRFSGLERPIVFGLHPQTVDKSIFPNFLVCLASRARQQLYILHHRALRVR